MIFLQDWISTNIYIYFKILLDMSKIFPSHLSGIVLFDRVYLVPFINSSEKKTNSFHLLFRIMLLLETEQFNFHNLGELQTVPLPRSLQVETLIHIRAECIQYVQSIPEGTIKKNKLTGDNYYDIVKEQNIDLSLIHI